MVSTTASAAGRGRLFWVWLAGNGVLLLLAAAVWAWGEYRYVKLYRPPEEMRALSQWIIYSLPVAALLLNLFLLRRLCLWRHLVYAFMSMVLVSAAWWGLFHTVGVRWHLSLGGVMH